jgi:membrane protein DedA with SNARE-associated domain
MVTNFAVRCLETSGYLGAGFLMALESMIVPIPSEAVMPFVGFMVADGKWNVWLAVLFTTTGSITGSMISYAMGCYGGKPLVLRVGKYLLLDRHDLEKTEAFFSKRSGTVTIFLARFVPVVRHLISIPAGVGGMRVGPFVAATLIGATLWNSFLLICGMLLREHWMVVLKYSHEVDIAVIGLLAAGITWFVHGRLKRRADLLKSN